MNNPFITFNNGKRQYLKQLQGNGGGITALTGDVLASGSGSVNALLASIFAGGNFGDSTHVPRISVDTKGRIIGVTTFGIPGLTGTSMPKASDLGITTTGDQTAALNLIFLNPSYEGIIMDFVGGGTVTINGTVNCQGKMIYFQPFSSFVSSGSGIITNWVWAAAGYWQKCLDVSVTATGMKSAIDKLPVTWYGATPGGGDSQPAIQKCLDTAVANMITMKNVVCPDSTYFINSSLDIYSWDGSNYQACCISFTGESAFWQGSGTGTVIRTNGYFNTYALNVQRGKGVEIKRIKFQGGFTPPFTSGQAFYNCAFSAFTDGICRDSINSPFSGLVVDAYSSSVPGDGGYPGRTSWYRGTGDGGSTGTIVEDCFFTNFVIGVITSPTGLTTNAELMRLTKIQFFACKCCLVGCQDQEKLNVIEFSACWGQTHTYFTSGVGSGNGYGAITPGNWYIKGVNIAGAMNTFINRTGTGFFNMYVKDVYAESLGVIGMWNATQGDCMENCLFDFVDLATMPQYPKVGYHLISTGHLVIKNSSFRYYGTNNRMIMNGGYFENCSFNDVPVMFAGALKDCNIYNGAATGICNPSHDIYDSRVSYQNYYACGRYGYYDINQFNQGKEILMKISKNTTPLGFLAADNIANTASGVVVSGTTAVITPPNASDLNRITVGGLVFTGTQVVGVVSSIGGSTYSVQYVPANVTSGSYVISQAYSIYGLSFMGSCTSGSPTITGVVADFGSITNFINQGGFCKIQGFYQFRAYSQGARMLSYDSGAGTITMDRNASENGTNIYFTNNQAIKEVNQTSDSSGSGSAINNTEIMPKGSHYYDEVPTNAGRRDFIVTATGYFAVSVPTATMNELT